MGFREAREETIAAIPWLGNERGVAYEGTLGADQDAEIALLKDAAKMSASPFLCPGDALDKLGADFGIARFDGEPDGTTTTGYRGRLCVVWATRKKAGAAQAVIDSLRAYGIPDVQVVQDFEGHWFQGTNYARYQVIIGPDFGTLGFAPLVAPFTPGGGAVTGGSTATIQQVRAIKRQILELKAAHSYPVRVILRFSGVILSHINSTPPFTPGDPSRACRWDIGKLSVENIITAPFTPGGYEV